MERVGTEPSIAADPGWDALARTAAGDSIAFEILVGENQDRLLRLCERMLGDVEEARDAAQEVFFKLYRNAASFKPRGRLFTLLYRIGVNHCLNRIRRRNLVRFFRFSDPGEEDAAAFEASEPIDRRPGADETMDARERWLAARRGIEKLPANQRAVLILAKFEGLSYREIAEVLGISEGAVESRLFRAMRRLEAAQENARSTVSPAKRTRV